MRGHLGCRASRTSLELTIREIRGQGRLSQRRNRATFSAGVVTHAGTGWFTDLDNETYTADVTLDEGTFNWNTAPDQKPDEQHVIAH